MLQYRANKCVFKSLRKLSLVTLRSLKLSGNEFQADGYLKESPSAVRLQPVSRKDQESSTGGPEMLPRCDVGDWYRQRSTKYCGA